MRFMVLLFLFSFPIHAEAEDRAAFYGSWGTGKQCAGKPIKPGGSVLARPYEITADWLKHGDQWCQLNWGPVEKRDGGTFSAAHAHCGEDSLRTYFLGLELTGEKLRLRWDFPQISAPLQRCQKP